MSRPKRGGIFEIGSSMDIQSRVEELAQKIDKILQVMPTSTPPTSVIDVYSICLSPTHSVYDCSTAY